MAESWENSVKKETAQKLAEALKDATTLTVTTDYIEPAAVGGQQTTPITLKTTIALDADGPIRSPSVASRVPDLSSTPPSTKFTKPTSRQRSVTECRF